MKFKVEKSVSLSPNDNQTTLLLPAHKICRCFKGDQEEVEKLPRIQKGFLERGFIKLRPFERIEFETGITLENFNLFNIEDISIRSNEGCVVNKGLVVFNTKPIKKDGKVVVVLYNSNPFLTTVNKGDFIGELVCKELSIN